VLTISELETFDNMIAPFKIVEGVSLNRVVGKLKKHCCNILKTVCTGISLLTFFVSFHRC